ncbi:DUF7199 family protein [Mycolicibacterium aichiense]|uniref:Uncharacterized protein n=1 Tax=Mycolicibacterium aichiense TaxID=1799 RepID=A0AAD1HUS2_9MYCO|nr:hypothetical protein [Mycolicibacterium aichiense]MCV7016747.1 hypothetical protein [Mycolicibacterium aichiense]QFG08044.1 hypothetical protein SEA_HERBERTWM_77 [Mycobacterium phage Herbertwm]BBX09471.1 hypothetical protein MAIC_42740 [Mycolicibacterium aichiense]
MIQRIWATTLFILGLMIFAAAVAIAYSGEAHADVSARCYAHLAEIPASQKTTAAGDRRYHLEHGEFSPCTEQDANDGREAAVSRGPAASHDDDKRKDDDKKSRYCRKHWYC